MTRRKQTVRPTEGARELRTDPVGPQVVAAALAATRAVVMLRAFGGDHEMMLPVEQQVFTLGSSAGADLYLPFKHVSREHARVERHGNWLKVINKSPNLIFFGGSPAEEGPVEPGGRFTVATTELLALDGPLIGLRHTLARYLGFDAHRAVDAALVSVADRNAPPLLLAGPRGSELDRIARATHEASPRRDHPFEVFDVAKPSRELAAALERVGSGTLYVDVTSLRGKKASAALAEALFGAGRRIRPIVAAPDLRTARAVFDRAGDDMRTIDVPPVHQRTSEVPRLLNALLAELRSPHHLEELARSRYEAVCTFDWPLNHEDLRRTAHRLHAYLDADRNLSAAARALGLRSSDSLTEALIRVGVID